MEPKRHNPRCLKSPTSHPGRMAGEVGLSGRRVVVVGLGVSGLAAAQFLSRKGASVTVSEIRRREEIGSDVLENLSGAGVGVEAGGHREETFKNAHLVVLSPGVPHDTDLLRSVGEGGTPVIGELELAFRFLKTPVIAVTGTNGKSTVTAFIGAMLEGAGFGAFVGGNFGTPLVTYAAGPQEADYLVAEVSSFQLDTIETFRPAVSIILNITPDHLDRYADFDAYVRSKLRVFENQGSGGYVVLNDEDERLSRVTTPAGVTPLRYGLKKAPGRNAFIEEGVIKTLMCGDEGPSFETGGFRLPGRHNLENLLGAVLVGLSLSLPPSAIQKTIDTFRGLPNRIEWVGTAEGVDFFNDSKATNVDAAVRAVQSFERPLLLIAGGRHKGADYAPLVRASAGRVKEAFFMGEAKELLASSFAGVLPYTLVEDMEEAVSKASSSAVEGDVVLLAPACSSFDMFSDYGHRGRVFRAAVEGLIER